jgi:O-antigen/teichoic acid export membrane protein
MTLGTHRIHGHLLARNATMQFVGQAGPLLLGLATIPFVVRGLGPDRFGLLSLAWALIGYFSVFDLGLGRAATKRVSEALAKGQTSALGDIVWSAAIAQVALGAAGAVVLVALARPLVEHSLKMPADLVEEARGGLYILAASIPIFLVIGSLRGVLEAAQRFDLTNLIRAPYLSSYFIMPLVGVLLGFDLRGIIALLVLAGALALVAYAWLCLRLFPTLRIRPRVRGPEFRALLAFGGWISVTAIVGPVLVLLDRFMIGALMSVAAVGYYAAAYEMVTRLWIVPGSLAATLFPAFVALKTSGEEERLGVLLRAALRQLLLVLGPLVAVLIPFSHDVLRLMFGSEYAARSAVVLQILSVGVLVNCLAFIPVALIQGIDRPDVTAKLHLIELPIHAALVLLLVWKFGIVGAALAWSIRAALDAVLQFAAAARLVALARGFALGDRAPRTLALLAGVDVVAWRVVELVATEWARFLAGGILMAIVALVIWRYLLDSRERAHLTRLLRPLASTI